jgi:hypothetical protein
MRGSPALRSRLLGAADYLAAMRELVPINADAPLEVWTGAADPDALRELAEGNGLRGPVQRLQAALESAASVGGTSEPRG